MVARERTAANCCELRWCSSWSRWAAKYSRSSFASRLASPRFFGLGQNSPLLGRRQRLRLCLGYANGEGPWARQGGCNLFSLEESLVLSLFLSLLFLNLLHVLCLNTRDQISCWTLVMFPQGVAATFWSSDLPGLNFVYLLLWIRSQPLDLIPSLSIDLCSEAIRFSNQVSKSSSRPKKY